MKIHTIIAIVFLGIVSVLSFQNCDQQESQGSLSKETPAPPPVTITDPILEGPILKVDEDFEDWDWDLEDPYSCGSPGRRPCEDIFGYDNGRSIFLSIGSDQALAGWAGGKAKFHGQREDLTQTWMAIMKNAPNSGFMTKLPSVRYKGRADFTFYIKRGSSTSFDSIIFEHVNFDDEFFASALVLGIDFSGNGEVYMGVDTTETGFMQLYNWGISLKEGFYHMQITRRMVAEVDSYEIKLKHYDPSGSIIFAETVPVTDSMKAVLDGNDYLFIGAKGGLGTKIGFDNIKIRW